MKNRTVELIVDKKVTSIVQQQSRIPLGYWKTILVRLPDTTGWSTAVVIVRKKDDSIWLCVHRGLQTQL